MPTGQAPIIFEYDNIKVTAIEEEFVFDPNFFPPLIPDELINQGEPDIETDPESE